ncbi:pyridoxal phosphate-dependent aminotransferase [Conexibacter sp. SYSU D00693]|uniref:pyridoxal phosphate-dependent aminotransferase n=1 Tax=Conexibacter sp. SYSU D00693 TaxID=2812560 RepID=UPI00196BA05F|nr:aminotransferase class I/II-fold pyridoxal phosphate-dependent enzyme [Conexibacter sp. SYSU D00693]
MTRRPAPDLVRRLPEQVFTRMLAAAAAAQARPGPRFLDLGRGNPDLPPPPAAIAAVQEAAAQTATPVVHGYPPFQGRPELRQAIADRYGRDHGVTLDPDTEVAVVPGTKTGIQLVCLATAQPGDTVLLPDPGYPDYRSGVALAGARERALPLDAATGWQPDWGAVRGDREALCVLNYPSNPCAACEAPGTFEHAVARAHERGGWLLHDLAYGFLAFDGRRGRSVLEVDGARDVAVELWSPSKVHGMAGWRVGFLVGNAEVVGRVKTLVDHLTAGVWTALQRGLEVALTDAQDVAGRAAVYAARRDRLVAGLRAAGADVAAPEGTFYAWWRPPEGVTVEVLAQEARVGVAPGEGFGARGAGYVRLSLALPDADLDEAVGRVAQLLRDRRAAG